MIMGTALLYKNISLSNDNDKDAYLYQVFTFDLPKDTSTFDSHEYDFSIPECDMIIWKKYNTSYSSLGTGIWSISDYITRTSYDVDKYTLHIWKNVSSGSFTDFIGSNGSYDYRPLTFTKQNLHIGQSRANWANFAGTYQLVFCWSPD